MYHKSVLVKEVLHFMSPRPGGVYVDVTFGGGGHTRALLTAQPDCKVIAFDWDRTALEINGPAIEEEFPGRVQLIWGNFVHLARLLKKNKIGHVDGILADFGTSQFQLLHQPGFSFSSDTPLDMRMAPGHGQTTAADIINKAPVNELATIFYEYGEERHSRAIARAIDEFRREEPFVTTRQLATLVERIIPAYSRTTHPATKVFQALRIVVNRELENITAFLHQALSVLDPHGRLVCISFHSLEDRIVKQFFKEHKATLAVLTPKVITATEEEITINPSSRSAKLRAVEKQ